MANVIRVNGHLVLRSDWDLSDVHNQADFMNVTLTDEQAGQVLEADNAIANVMADAQALAHEADQNSF